MQNWYIVCTRPLVPYRIYNTANIHKEKTTLSILRVKNKLFCQSNLDKTF